MGLIFILAFILLAQTSVSPQCNEGLNLGAVIVPAHGNASNNGNFSNPGAWQEAAGWVDSLNLDYRQKYITWTDVVLEINNHIPLYSNYYFFENQLNFWAGNPSVHIVYPTISVSELNTLMPSPLGFVSDYNLNDPNFFSDTAYVNQNYNAILHILQNVNNIKWISIGNEIDAYFKGTYWGTGRLTRYASFLDTVRARMNRDGFSYVKLGTIVAFHNLFWLGNFDIIDSVLSHIDFIGYTFYFTTSGPPNDTCWGEPNSAISWLNMAKAMAGNKALMITETSMGDGGGTSQNCGSDEKQLSYANALLDWYSSDTSKIAGITWFTIVDPYLSWQTTNTLWNTCGLIDSNAISVQSAGTVWKHNCGVSEVEIIRAPRVTLSFFPNPFSKQATLNVNKNLNDAVLTIYNVYGAKVYELKDVNGYSKVLDRGNLPSGIYFLSITEKNITLAVNKFIIVD